jgi:cellulose synthase (UDP-forming)
MRILVFIVFMVFNKDRKPDVWNSGDFPDVYKYVRNKEYLIRLLGVLSMIVMLIMTIGYIYFLSTATWYWFVFFPPILLILFNRVPRYFMQSVFKQLSIKKHRGFVNNFWRNNKQPAIDVFLTYAGEDIDIYEAVINGCCNLKYENKHIYLLDDSLNPGVAGLAEKYNCVHLKRPNRGEYKKSGNLRYGYENSKSPIVVVFDADFIPNPDFLLHTVPYMAVDEKIGILQTPQYFEQSDAVHNRSMIEYGGASVVELFYSIDMPARDRFGAAMCVGTSALYRRSAIEAGGGPPNVWGTEDVRQGLLINRYGYKVRYLPLVLSIGLCPESPQSYFKQHNRWCTGSIQMVLSSFLWRSKLKFIGKWIYMTNGFFYMAEVLSVVLSFHLLSLIDISGGGVMDISNFKWFIGYIVVQYLFEYILRIYPKRIGSNISGILQQYTYAYTVIEIAQNKRASWHPAGAKDGGLDKGFLYSVRIAHGVWWLQIVYFLYILMNSSQDLLYNYNTYLVVFWIMYASIKQVVFLYYIQGWINKQRLKSSDSGDIVRKKILLEMQKIFPVVVFSFVISFVLYHIINNIFM